MKPRQGDINLAKTQIKKDEELDDRLAEKFDKVGSSWIWRGSREELQKVRTSLGKYRRSSDSAAYERKSLMEAQRLLQHIPVQQQ
jgi:ribosomal protein RSM22 (predicted rRNA methylase)